MARRVLSKIDPQLDLSRHLWQVTDLPQPWDPVAVFDRAAPLEVEVGSGKGLFLLRAAEAYAVRDFFGIELVAKYARFAASRLARRGVANARMLHANALDVFDAIFPDSSLAAVHVYFPDPWWKQRHRRRRVMNESFVVAVERCLRPGGQLHFWTDVAPYFQESVDLIRSATRLAGPFAVAEAPALHDMDYRTHFERRVRLNNRPVNRAEFRKPDWQVQLITDPEFRCDIVESETTA